MLFGYVLTIQVVCFLLFFGFSRPSLTSSEPSSRNFRFSRPKSLEAGQVQVYHRVAQFEDYGELGECYGTSPNLLCRMDLLISADIFTGSLFLNPPSPLPSSPIFTLPFLALRFPFQRYLTLPPLVIRLCMLELLRRPSTSRLLAILHPLVSLLPEI